MPRRLPAARLRFALAGLLALLLIGACSREPEAVGPLVMDQNEHERWEIALVEMRIEKNEAFARPGTSPLSAEALTGFEGLNYYFPEPDLRFRATLVRAAGTDTVKLAKGKGDIVPYIRRGTVSFRHGGSNHKLSVFGPADGSGDLWLPFYDASNGPDTYPGGRYLDLEPAADGTVDLDFNYAYSPYCDYDAERWNCTLPPAENTLAFPVVAGEKRFSSGH